MNNNERGIVYLVGAGPGAPELITLKGLECVRRAEVLVYDRLVSPRLLQQAKKGTELVYVGKMPDHHALDQEEINRLLVDRAGRGRVVTRLKGGDPFVFGRGGEEAAALAAKEIPFEIVPGITSAVAVPAYAGIPVTHRGMVSAFTVITGHEDPTKPESDLNWQALADGGGTLVILMGMGNLAPITGRLLEKGMDPQTPVALVHRGTEAAQRTLRGTLAGIAEKAKQENFGPPAVIVLGSVVGMREELQWFEKKPLFGRRIVVSRARAQASAFAARLEELGAETIEFPVIEIVPPTDYTGLDRALAALNTYHWVIFTSENGVAHFFSRLAARGGDIRDLKGAALCAIGPKTREVLECRGLRVDYVPSEFRAEAVVDLLKNRIIPGEKVLLPRADLARPILPAALAKLGAEVDSVVAYRTVRGEGDSALLGRLLAAGEIDMVTFTSSSTVRNLVMMLGSEAGALLEGVTLAAIGPVTAATARELGLTVKVEAGRYTIEGLVDVVRSFYEKKEG